jgi:hypothetical protein
VVVFPAPFGPRNPVTLPGWHVNETPSTAVNLPYVLETSDADITTVLAGKEHPT